MWKNKSVWVKYIRDYRFGSIFLKNLMLMFLVIILPFVCVIATLLYTYTSDQKKEQMFYAERILNQITSDIDHTLQQMKEKAIILGQIDEMLFFYWDGKEETCNFDVRYLIDYTAMLTNTTDYLDSVYVYAPKSQKVISPSGMRDFQNFYDKECIENVSDNQEKFQMIYNDRDVMGLGRKKSLSLYYQNITSGGAKGLVIVNLDVEKAIKKFRYGDNVSYKVIQNDEILFSSDLSEIGNKIEGGRPDSRILNDGQRILTADLQGENQWVMVSVKPLSHANGEMQSFSEIICLVLLILLMTVVLAFYLTNKMFRPIEEILSVIEEIHEKTEQEEESQKDENEIHYIIRAIYSTIQKNADFEQELQQRAILLKKAQAVALQSQINPHFMNNTLETINWMAIKHLGAENELSRMITNLSDIMRISLENTDIFVRLDEEIQYANLYLQIMEKRYENRFFVSWDIQEEVLNCRTIKMILQPILENAICYGILPYKELGEIQVKAMREGNRVKIVIGDSGEGIVPEEVERINQNMQRSVIQESRHIGLCNVNRRIVLAYGEEYGVSLQSEMYMGTKVMLSIPFQLK